MTSIAQVTALVDAHVRSDRARFRAVTLQIAANLADRSPSNAAQLRKLVEPQQAAALVPLPSASGLLSAPAELLCFDDMVLAPAVRDLLDRVVLEHAQRDVLSVHGLSPARKLLFTGPPGVGKTMARVELHGVISSHLGETAGKLAKVFEHVRAMTALYLFDEFDALCAQRASGGEANAEMRRVVNSFLQFIEDDSSDSFMVAATNHDEFLDSAIFRRFDETVAFGNPSKSELTTLLYRTLIDVDVGQLDVAAIYAAVANPRLGYGDVCAALDRVRKDYVIAGAPIDTRAIVAAIARRSHGARTEVSP